MNTHKLIETVIANGEAILENGINKEEVFSAWFKHAECALKKVFGEEWESYSLWEGYKSESTWADERARLRRAIGYLRNAALLLPSEIISLQENQSKKDPIIEKNIKEKPQNIFIVHGHDEITKLELKNYLQNVLQLPEPIILHEKPNHGKTIIEKFEEYAMKSTIAFILLTPDDKVYDGINLKDNLYRARQNVILELGYFIGVLGRRSGKVILLFKGHIDIPSDISGLIYIDINNGIEASGEKIRRELLTGTK